MRILWASNAPYVGTGYGVQTNHFLRKLIEDGHEVVVYGTFGHHSTAFDTGAYKILPMGQEAYGIDMLKWYAEKYKVDAVIFLYDAWVLPDKILSDVPMTAYAPIDHKEVPPDVLRALKQCRHVIAMSGHGLAALRRAGLNPYYGPHVVDTRLYRPVERPEARRRWGFDDDKFVVSMVAANKGYPSRKNFEVAFKAFAKLAQNHPDALLYVHTEPTGKHSGLDLIECARFYGIDDANIVYPVHGRMVEGSYTFTWMNWLYNASDVLLAPSAGEGFGVPVIEAQAAGCPVIVSDFTAQSELCGAGWKIPIYEDDLVYSRQQGEQCRPRPSEIYKALESAYAARGNATLRDKARWFGFSYDVDILWENRWRHIIEDMARKDKWLERSA